MINVYKFGAEVQHRWQNLLLLALLRMNIPTDSSQTRGTSQYVKKRKLMGMMRFVTDSAHVIDNTSELLVLLFSRPDPASKLATLCTRIWNRCNRLIQGLELDDLKCPFQPKPFYKF